MADKFISQLPAAATVNATDVMAAWQDPFTVKMAASLIFGAVTLAGSATGNTTNDSTGTFNASQLTLRGAGGASVGYSNGSIVISAGAGGAGDGFNRLSAGTQIADTNTTVLFADSNGVTFGMDGSSRITATVKTDYLTSQSNQNVTAQNGGFAFQTLSFSNANGVSFGTSAGSAITASHNAITSQTNQSAGIYALGNTTGESSSSTYDARTLSVEGAGIVSVGWSNSSLRVSATQSNQAASAANGSFAFQTLSFSNLNGISFGTSAGSAITASHNALTSQSNQAVSADGSFTFQTLSFSNANGFSFGTSGATAITGSYTRPVVSNAIQSVGSATGSGTNTSRFAADDHVHAGVFSVGVSTGGNTAGNTRVDVGRFVFVGSNLTLSQDTAAGALNTIVISAAAPGAAAITQSFGISNTTAGGATAGTSGMVSGDDIRYVFVPGSNITMSQSIDAGGSSGTLSIYGPAAGGGNTLSKFAWPLHEWTAISTNVQGSVSLNPFLLHEALTATRLHFGGSMSVITVAAASQVWTFTANAGIYTRNASTLSLASSGSTTWTTSLSSNSAHSSLVHGMRRLSVPIDVNATPGEYWLGLRFSSTVGTATNHGIGFTLYGGLRIATANAWANIGEATTITKGNSLGMGLFSATTAAMPGSIAFSQISHSGSNQQRANIFFELVNYTVW